MGIEPFCTVNQTQHCKCSGKKFTCKSCVQNYVQRCRDVSKDIGARDGPCTRCYTTRVTGLLYNCNRCRCNEYRLGEARPGIEPFRSCQQCAGNKPKITMSNAHKNGRVCGCA